MFGRSSPAQPSLMSRPIFFILLLPPPPRSTLFPYTTLFRSLRRRPLAPVLAPARPEQRLEAGVARGAQPGLGDRKSTRLNSSHVEISYAVFCLKKNKE